MANKQHLRDWFAVGCGLFGIWELLRAVESVIFAFNLVNGWYRSTTYTFAGEMLFAIAHFFLGLSLLASAKKLAAFWYPDMAKDKASDQNNSDCNTTNV
jgi:hypothetical protein